jgi:hypothetical protein
MAKDIATFHRWLIAVQKMQVRPADGAAGYFDNGISGVLDFGIGNSIDANVTFSVPAKSAHIETSVDDIPQLNDPVDVPL